MLRVLLRRIVLTIPVVFGVATIVFALLHVVPGDPVQTMLGDNATPREVAALRRTLGLDAPLPVQYRRFLTEALHGRLGTSIRTGQPVTAAIGERVGATVELAVAAMTVCLVLALPGGILAAARQGSRTDTTLTTCALVGLSMPAFWVGPVLAIVGAVWLGWLPVSGRGTWAHLVLPTVTLAAPLAAVVLRMVRASVLDERGALYVLAARARGASPTRALLRHAVRNSLIPVTTILALQFGAVLTGAVVTETIFAWPGIGRLLVQAIGARDYPVVQGCVLLIAITYVGVNLLADLCYAWLDPRVRVE